MEVLTNACASCGVAIEAGYRLCSPCDLEERSYRVNAMRGGKPPGRRRKNSKTGLWEGVQMPLFD